MLSQFTLPSNMGALHVGRPTPKTQNIESLSRIPPNLLWTNIESSADLKNIMWDFFPANSFLRVQQIPFVRGSTPCGLLAGLY